MMKFNYLTMLLLFVVSTANAKPIFLNERITPDLKSFSILIGQVPTEGLSISAVIDRRYKPSIDARREGSTLNVSLKSDRLPSAKSIEIEVLQHGRPVAVRTIPIQDLIASLYGADNGTSVPSVRLATRQEGFITPNMGGVIKPKLSKPNDTVAPTQGIKLFNLPDHKNYRRLTETWSIKAFNTEEGSTVGKRVRPHFDGSRYSVKSETAIPTSSNIFVDTGEDYYVYFKRPKEGDITISDLDRYAAHFNIRGVSDAQKVAGLYAYYKRDYDSSGLAYNTLYSIPSKRVLTYFNRKESRIIRGNIERFGSAPLPKYLPEVNLGLAQRLSCRNFKIDRDFLKNSIKRNLAKCGYKIGNWRFGDENFEQDYFIDHEWGISDIGLLSFLDAIEKTYFLKGLPKQADRSVSFEPTRGNVNTELRL